MVRINNGGGLVRPMEKFVALILSWRTGSPQESFSPARMQTRLSHKGSLAIAAAIVLCSTLPAQAQTCIAQKSSMPHKAQHYTNAQGQSAVRAVDTGAIGSGDELINTIAVSNGCTLPAANVVIDRAVPEHMTYVKGTAKGDGTDRVFSVDGVTYGRWDSLRVKNTDGSLRPVTPKDIKFIRWVFKTVLQPGAGSMLRYDLIQN